MRYFEGYLAVNYVKGCHEECYLNDNWLFGVLVLVDK